MTEQWGWRCHWYDDEDFDHVLDDWIAVSDWFAKESEYRPNSEITIVWWDTDDD